MAPTGAAGKAGHRSSQGFLSPFAPRGIGNLSGSPRAAGRGFPCESLQVPAHGKSGRGRTSADRQKIKPRKGFCGGIEFELEGRAGNLNSLLRREAGNFEWRAENVKVPKQRAHPRAETDPPAAQRARVRQAANFSSGSRRFQGRAPRYPCFSASATETDIGVVGRPISFESARPSSNNAPSEAPTSQLAIARAIGSGRPKPVSALA